MKKEIFELLKTEGEVRTFKILAFPTTGKMRIDLAENNNLGIEDVTIDLPAEINHARIGSTVKVIGNPEEGINYALAAAPAKTSKDKPQGNRRTPTSYQVSGSNKNSAW